MDNNKTNYTELQSPHFTVSKGTDEGFRRLVRKEKQERLKILKDKYKYEIALQKKTLGRKLNAQEMKDLKIKTAVALYS